jgi:hypothetical protein
MRALLDLLVEFDFLADGDKSRAVASLLTPALKLGRWITGHHPADVAEADQSQSGKTYRQKLVMALSNERAYLWPAGSAALVRLMNRMPRRSWVAARLSW